jgi:hypothetical protein
MDTKTLVVGQDVYLYSGCYWIQGKVVKVTPSGVDVQGGLGYSKEDAAEQILHFDKDGRSYLTESPDSQDWKINGTYECGPWHIDDMPFAERKAGLD